MPSFSFDIEVPELRASYVRVERSDTGSGGWVQKGSDIKVRPGQTYNFEDTDFAVEDLPLYYRVTTYTSDDTAGTPTANIENDGS
ncbi:hypothetical protein GN330_16440 [Nitratireductor sp. CAU 1489]|uniref:Uncharacterized protein n=1 Tax=Nitratireductor arenosus TaxID=2682096 RepID=A0A844QI15_9HYPH|nr:hypothetical protein [Nitratireductor arenosus]MVA98837.1 hypothetical protein [Nitratireductor arenosus]